MWVFTRAGSTWTQQGAKLTGTEEDFEPGEAGSEELDEEVGNGYFGDSVGLSADGATALIGGPRDGGGAGAAWVFTRTGSTWTQQGAKLTGGEELGKGQFGCAGALSGDGATALIGGLEDGGGIRAAWLFPIAGSTWTQQAAKLTGGEELGKGQFGWGVALSGDGATALIGGLGDHAKVGAAWVFGDPPPEPATPSQPETPPTTTPTAQSTATQPATTPPPTAKSGVQAASAAGGRVTLARTTVTMRANGRAAVRLRCIAVLPCTGRLTITAATKSPRGRSRSATVGTASFSIPAGRLTTVKVRLNSAGRALLSAHRGRLTVKLAIRKRSPHPADADLRLASCCGPPPTGPPPRGGWRRTPWADQRRRADASRADRRGPWRRTVWLLPETRMPSLTLTARGRNPWRMLTQGAEARAARGAPPRHGGAHVYRSASAGSAGTRPEPRPPPA